MLSAQNLLNKTIESLNSITEALNAGFDDYLIKPFDFNLAMELFDNFDGVQNCFVLLKHKNIQQADVWRFYLLGFKFNPSRLLVMFLPEHLTVVTNLFFIITFTPASMECSLLKRSAAKNTL